MRKKKLLLAVIWVLLHMVKNGNLVSGENNEEGLLDEDGNLAGANGEKLHAAPQWDPMDPFSYEQPEEEVVEKVKRKENTAAPPQSDKPLEREFGEDTLKSEDSSVVTKRLISAILNSIDEISPTDDYTASVTLKKENIESLRKFVDGEGVSMLDATEIIVNSISSIVPTHPQPSGAVHWLTEHQDQIQSMLQIVLIILITITILTVTLNIWRRMGSFRFFAFILLICFCISVPWTWMHMYKQNIAGRMKRGSEGLYPPPECDARGLSWWQLIGHDYRGKCEKYYEDILIDPLWEVKPTQAIAVTFVEFFWKPLEVMGAPLGSFIRDVLEPLPFYLKPVVAVSGLVFICFCLLLSCGSHRIWTWFFTIEPVAAPLPAAPPQPAAPPLPAPVTGQRTGAEQSWRPAPVPRQTSGVVTLTAGGDAADDDQRSPDVLAGGDAGAESADEETHILLRPFSLLRADHVVLTTRNIQTIIDFYSKLNVRIESFAADRKAMHFEKFKINIHSTESRIVPRARSSAPGSLDLCIICNCSVETTIKHLKVSDISIEVGPVKKTGALGDITSVYIRDPDCNLIELAHYPPPADQLLHVTHSGKNIEDKSDFSSSKSLRTD